MKIIHLLLIFFVFSLSGLHCEGQTEKELKSKKIKIITTSEEILITTQVLLGDSVLKFTGDMAIDSIAYTDIVYIYIKEGSNFPKLMAYCVSLGLCYGIIWGLLSTTGTFIGNIAIGLVSGVIAGLIVAPFTTKPEKLIFYKGKWTDSKYAP
jgi:hypothetical protein